MGEPGFTKMHLVVDSAGEEQVTFCIEGSVAIPDLRTDLFNTLVANQQLSFRHRSLVYYLRINYPGSHPAKINSNPWKPILRCGLK